MILCISVVSFVMSPLPFLIFFLSLLFFFLTNQLEVCQFYLLKNQLLGCWALIHCSPFSPAKEVTLLASSGTPPASCAVALGRGAAGKIPFTLSNTSKFTCFFFFPPVDCWNLSSSRLDFHKGYFNHWESTQVSTVLVFLDRG